MIPAAQAVTLGKSAIWWGGRRQGGCCRRVQAARCSEAGAAARRAGFLRCAPAGEGLWLSRHSRDDAARFRTTFRPSPPTLHDAATPENHLRRHTSRSCSSHRRRVGSHRPERRGASRAARRRHVHDQGPRHSRSGAKASSWRPRAITPARCRCWSARRRRRRCGRRRSELRARRRRIRWAARSRTSAASTRPPPSSSARWRPSRARSTTRRASRRRSSRTIWAPCAPARPRRRGRGALTRRPRLRVDEADPELPATGARRADALNNLADLRHSQGDLEEAERLYADALARREAALGAEHPETAASVNNLAVLLLELRRHREALPLLRARRTSRGRRRAPPTRTTPPRSATWRAGCSCSARRRRRGRASRAR